MDTSVITPWILTEDEPEKREKLPDRAKKCIDLLDFKIAGKFNCDFITSDWSISEMIQSIRDRSVFKKFYYDGYEFAAFQRLKPDYNLEESEIVDIMSYVEDFSQYLMDLDIQIIELKLDWREMHKYCLVYGLQIPDAAHVLLARRESHYLATIDSALKKVKIPEINIVDPADLITRMEFRSS